MKNLGCLAWGAIIIAILLGCTILDKLFGIGGICLIAIAILAIIKKIN